MKTKKSILVVGSIAFDSIKTPSANYNNLLGGSASYFAIAASYFRKVNILGVVGNDFPKKYWNLYSQFGINIDNVEVKDGTTFRWGGKYSDDYNSRDTLFTDLGVFENYTPIITESLYESKFIFLGNIHPDMQMSIIKKGTGKHLIHTRNPMAKNEICGFDIDGNIIKGEHEFNNTDIIEKLIIIKNEYENKNNNEGKMNIKKSDIYNLEDSTNIKIIKTSHHMKLLLDRQMKEIKTEYEQKEKLINREVQITKTINTTTNNLKQDQSKS